MRNIYTRIATLVICLTLIFSGLYFEGFNIKTFALTDAEKLQADINDLQAEAKEIQAEINRLKSQANNQSAVLNAVRKKVANTQAQITRCNQEINKINSAIAANKAEIDKTNKAIEKDKLEFKKRIRAIYMSNTDSNVKLLLGAQNFSEFLQLAQLTASISSRDKAIMEDLKKAIDKLNKKNEENNKLLESQVAVKAAVQKQYDALAAEEAEAQRIYDDINSDKKAQEADLRRNQETLRMKQEALSDFGSHLNSTQGFINPNTNMMWPVPSCRIVYSGYKTSNRPDHLGIDISGAGIYQKPIVAVADGVIYKSHTTCTHRSKTSYCRCGSGFGNHLRIDHGDMTIGGKTQHFGAIYAHMDTVAVASGSVKQGQIIGYVGTTGDSTGYHLHFSLLIGGTNYKANTVDPMLYLRAR